MAGHRVGLVDTDFESPALHNLFSLTEQDVRHSINDFLWGKCDIEQAALNLTPRLRLAEAVSGELFLVPASAQFSEVSRILHGGYYIQLLNDGFQALNEALRLDYLIIDPHAGLNEETLFTLAVSDATGLILRPDHQDYQGTSIMLEVAHKLNVPRIKLIVNEVAEVYDRAEVKSQVEKTYQCEVAAILPHSEDMQLLASEGIFVLRHGNHHLTTAFRQLSTHLLR